MAKVVLFLMLILSSSNVYCFSNKEEDGTVVNLTMGSWRTDDIRQMRALFREFSKEYPNIRVEFQPIIPADYNATLRLQLESGIAPDIIYTRSFTTGKQLYREGYLADVSSLKDYEDSYSKKNREPWVTEDGIPFAVPFAAVSHGIYYNKDILDELGLSLPGSWRELLNLCSIVKAKGYIPIANGLSDEWDIAEVLLMNIAPNFIGGVEGRLAYERGEKPFNSTEVVRLFRAIANLEPYLPRGYEALGYNDSNALFATGQAFMFFDGSWSIESFKDVSFNWDVMAPPPLQGKESYITYHPDAGVGINSSTRHMEEARILLEWFGSERGAQALAKYLPKGFYPMSENRVVIEDIHARSFLQLNEGRGRDVRWPWPELLAGEPSGYTLMQNGAIGVILGTLTPTQAANSLEKGLSEWYLPAQ